ncbi:hypothetical protein G7Y89_g1135 [Cudoniella acicularis]|uniref:ATPase V1 complex subunit H C-terminal domain-containing protein n=1 Tax=Cudoniella acicularis TaxID=354080 RepID=A0A8H4W7P9_9HELO|nr:hypothetical protein G7Y89_g1135 [Cudoniella acicularis]
MHVTTISTFRDFGSFLSRVALHCVCSSLLLSSLSFEDELELPQQDKILLPFRIVDMSVSNDPEGKANEILVLDRPSRRLAFNGTMLVACIFGLCLGAPDTYDSILALTAFSGFGIGGNIPIDTTICLEFLPRVKNIPHPSHKSSQCRRCNITWQTFQAISDNLTSEATTPDGSQTGDNEFPDRIDAIISILKKTKSEFKRISVLFSTPTLVCLTVLIWITYAFDYWGFSIVGAFLPTILAHKNSSIHVSISETYRDYVIIYLPGIVGVGLGASMVYVPRIGRKWAMVFSSALVGTSLFLFAAVNTQASNVGVNAMEYFFQSMFNSVLYGWTPEAYPATVQGHWIQKPPKEEESLNPVQLYGVAISPVELISSPIMSLDPPTYLASLQNNIRLRSIPWDGAVRAGTISDDQLSKIRAVDKVRKDQRKAIVEGDLEGYRTLFVGASGKPSVLESVAKSAHVVQYVLVLLGDLLDGIPALSKALSEHPDPYEPFLPFLAQSNDPESPIPLLTSTVLASMIGNAPSVSAKGELAMPQLFSYLSTLTKNTDGGLQDIAVLEYSALLRGKKSRELFWDHRSETVGPLIDILRAVASVGSNGDSASTLWSGASSVRTNIEGSLGGGVGLQLLYHVLLVLWQLSFEGAIIGEGLEDEYDIIPLYTQLLRLSPKEKTTRLLISSLYNLLSSNRQTLLPAAVLARLPALLQNITGRHLTDPDLQEDLQNLSEILDEYTKTQTTFDEYAAEVNSGHLRWSPPHRSPTFWAENARRILEHEKGELPRKLAEIMSKSWDNDKQVLAIACNDVGFLVKEVPEKRYQLEKLGLKTRVMELMAEKEESVRWESLNALSGWLRYSFETK